MKKILTIGALFLTMSSALVGCGSNRADDGSYYDRHDYTYDDNSRTTGTAASRVKDAVDGAGEAAKDIIDGVEDAGEDIIDGVTGNKTSASTAKTSRKTTSD